jgi:hypothetical protein
MNIRPEQTSPDRIVSDLAKASLAVIEVGINKGHDNYGQRHRDNSLYAP